MRDGEYVSNSESIGASASASVAPSIGIAIVLAGGSSLRMAGEDKLAMALADRPLLDHALSAIADVPVTVVVGPRRPTLLPVRWTREEPPGGGPVAGIAAGLAATTAEDQSGGLVAVIAGDMPFAGRELHTLAAALVAGGADVAFAVGNDDRDQPLLAVWHVEALAAALEPLDSVAGRSVRSLLADVVVSRVPVANAATLDCDEPGDLERLARVARNVTHNE